MGYADMSTGNLFLAQPLRPEVANTPQEARHEAMLGTPAERAEFLRRVYVQTDQFKFSFEFISNLIDRAKRTKFPGGLWLIGDGGTGKSFLLERIYRGYPPIDTDLSRIVPVLAISLNEKTSESSILSSMLLQLGQDPELLHYKNNDDLREQAVDALQATGTRAILFDESHHIWLKPNGSGRSTDRSGGSVGGSLMRLYDRTGLAMIFAGTPGLEKVLELNDKQSNTRWEGRVRLTEFAFDGKFLGLLAALDEAMPFPEKSSLAEEGRAKKIHLATKGNFRSLKNFLAEAVYLAAESNSPCVKDEHLRQAFYRNYGFQLNPFDDAATS